jgi:hypothetical protein
MRAARRGFLRGVLAGAVGAVPLLVPRSLLAFGRRRHQVACCPVIVVGPGYGPVTCSFPADQLPSTTAIKGAGFFCSWGIFDTGVTVTSVTTNQPDTTGMNQQVANSSSTAVVIDNNRKTWTCTHICPPAATFDLVVRFKINNVDQTPVSFKGYSCDSNP